MDLIPRTIPSRTDRRGHKDHIHILVEERFTYPHDDGVYRYRCTVCGQRLKRKSGVLASKEAK